MTESVPLGEVASVFNGKTPAKSEKRAEGHPVLKIKNVGSNGDFGGFESFVDSDFAERHAKKSIRENDVLVLNAAHNADYVGSKMFQASKQVEGAIATGEWLLARSSSERLSQEYLWHWFQAPQTRFQIRNRVKGIHLYPRDVAELPIPLPPREIQTRIATILDKADAIRRRHVRLVEIKNQFARSAYVHTVGHLNPSHGDWEPYTIEALSEDRKGAIRSGPFGSALRHGEFVDEGIAVLGIDNAVQNKFAWAERRFITASKYEELRRYTVFPGDVIITIMGTTGRSAVVPHDIPESITTKHLATITCNKELIHPEVLSFAIHSDPLIIRQIKSFNKGAIMDGLNLGIIRKLEINLPPMAEQLRFVAMLQKARAIEAKSQTPDGSGEDLFESLSQRAFRGEL